MLNVYIYIALVTSLSPHKFILKKFLVCLVNAFACNMPFEAKIHSLANSFESMKSGTLALFFTNFNSLLLFQTFLTIDMRKFIYPPN